MKSRIFALVAGTALAAFIAAPVFAGSALPFKSAGSGTESSLSAAGCQFTLAGCTVESDGTAISSHLGKGAYTSTLTIDWAAATSNGSGGYCAPASGTSTLTAANGDSLTFSESGTVCEVGATGIGVPHSFNGTYTITGGTGRFVGAGGTGTITGGDDGAGNSWYSLSGTLTR